MREIRSKADQKAVTPVLHLCLERVCGQEQDRLNTASDAAGDRRARRITREGIGCGGGCLLWWLPVGHAAYAALVIRPAVLFLEEGPETTETTDSVNEVYTV